MQTETIGVIAILRSNHISSDEKNMPKAGHLAKASNLQDIQNIPYIRYVNV